MVLTMKGVVEATRSSSQYPYISKEGYETLEHQCMSHIAAHHSISFEERGTQTLTFYMKFKSCFE